MFPEAKLHLEKSNQRVKAETRGERNKANKNMIIWGWEA